MSAHLDIDDACAPHPLAKQQLDDLRKTIAEWHGVLCQIAAKRRPSGTPTSEQLQQVCELAAKAIEREL